MNTIMLKKEKRNLDEKATHKIKMKLISKLDFLKKGVF